MKNLKDEVTKNSKKEDDVLSLRPPSNCRKRAKHSNVENPLQRNQIPLTIPMLVPYTASNSHNIQDAAHVNTIPPPFPWATDRRATVHTRKYLTENSIVTITGTVKCKRCKTKFEMGLELENKLGEVWKFIHDNKDNMHDRAPVEWVNPALPKCEHCGGQNSIQPHLVGTKKKAINWLFLFLSQTLGCCTLKHLKYFLKHTNIHRTGAKDRVLYSTYMALCKQLVPEFDFQ
ncbi:hypothetical protein Fmac_009168 [Flemingia macrophylla]|uniref:DUF7086 domain-containing protein n=1 Tax=Flemingia macrophylla TaxID=520843 RepID=A0ABD1MZK6_9FABA